jgi:hypothetical protein
MNCAQPLENKMPSRELDKKETYLYGTLLELTRENLAALEKHEKGVLGIWGRARASHRNEAIDKFVQKIIDRKVAADHADPIGEIVKDLEFIEQDTQVWDGISDASVKMVHKLISGS